MTREEAKEILTHNWTRVDNPNYSESELDEAFFMAIEALQAPTDGDIIRCKDCYWYDKGKNDCDSWEWCKRHKFDSYDEGFCSWATHKKQVTSKLKNPCDSLLTEDSEERKEQKSKLDLIRREDAIDAIDDAIDADSPQWAILRTKIGFLPSAKAVQEWIPCSDRLPSNDGCVLVTIDDGIEFGKYEDGSWSIWVCEHWDKWEAKGTIAWMPLPKPYREDGE